MGIISVGLLVITNLQNVKSTIMAEIRVETKKGSGNLAWLWVVLALVIVGAVIYYLMNRNKPAGTTTPPANTTGAIQKIIERISIADLLLRQNTAMYCCASNIREPKALLS